MKGVVVGAGVGGYVVPHDGCSVIDISIPPVYPRSQDVAKKEAETAVIPISRCNCLVPRPSVQYEACNYLELPKFSNGNMAYCLQFTIIGCIL